MGTEQWQLRALLFWQNHMRGESLRRLYLAAQRGETLFFMLRPIASALDASPAPLRLNLRLVVGGLNIEFTKRRGPRCDEVLFLPIGPIPSMSRRSAVPHSPAQI